ncbi:MAG: 30S ribosomal protein S21 [Candidatus Kerfeldbacteria bacterium]|nr:30S ribosomal protein S21 [Candidatus Kerfeldbacteria bacterium]
MYNPITYGLYDRPTTGGRGYLWSQPPPPIKSRKTGNGGVRVREGESIESAIRRLRHLLEKTRVTADTRRTYGRYEPPSVRKNKLLTRHKRANKRKREGTSSHLHFKPR